MRKKITVFVLLVTLISCTQKSENDNELLIIGDWKYLQEIPKYNPDDSLPPPPPPFRGSLVGYQFKENGIYDYKLGFYKEVFDKVKNKNKRVYLGRTSKYKITNDSLSLYDESDKTWSSYGIKSLKKDTLILVSKDNDISKWIKNQNPINKSKIFDKIIVSSSGCYGSCPVEDILIDSSGEIIFNGEDYSDNVGCFTAKTKKEEFVEIENDFQKADWYNLKNEYIASHTDDQTTSVTFIKNNRIVKTISDYGYEAPVEFFWAYREVKQLHQKIKLQKITNTDLLFDIYRADFEDKNTFLRLTKSETFFLKNLLFNAKKVEKQNVNKYKLRYWVNDSEKAILTDGRFYTFKTKDGKEITLDLGFDFLKENGFLNKFKVKTKDDY